MGVLVYLHIMNGIWYTAGMVRPTITRLPAHVQKSVLIDVIKLPMSNVAKQVKYEVRRPARSLSNPNKYTPTGPPTFRAAKPMVGYISLSHTKSNCNRTITVIYKYTIILDKLENGHLTKVMKWYTEWVYWHYLHELWIMNKEAGVFTDTKIRSPTSITMEDHTSVVLYSQPCWHFSIGHVASGFKSLTVSFSSNCVQLTA